MTTLLSWISVDNRGPSAIYVASDSRITWGSPGRRWDSGGKVFASGSPDIFGYCGDVVFPAIVLGQINDLANRGVLWTEENSACQRHAILVDYIKSSFAHRHSAPNYSFSIVHAALDGMQMNSQFSLWRTDFIADQNAWTDQVLEPMKAKTSSVLLELGSGAPAFKGELREWNESSQCGTARSIFSAFCDALKSKKDPLSGGVPQIVALDRISSGKLIGFIGEGKRYLNGLPIRYSTALDALEWRDELFQYVSPKTLKLLSNAQKRARVPRAGR